jgi:hypothetical protein
MTVSGMATPSGFRRPWCATCGPARKHRSADLEALSSGAREPVGGIDELRCDADALAFVAYACRWPKYRSSRWT